MADDTKILARTDAFIQSAMDATDEWRDRGRMSRKYYNGEQWSEADKALLLEQGRPSLTINHIRPLVNFLSGVQRHAHRDFKAWPRRGGVDGVAQVYTGLLKHANDLSDGHHHQSEMFKEGVQTGKGWISLSLDFDEDPFSGEIRLESVSPFNMWEDTSDQEYLLDTAKFLVRRRWLDSERIDKELPKTKREEVSAQATKSSGPDTNTASDLTNFLFSGSDNLGDDIEDEDINATRQHRYPMLEIWWREPVKRGFLLDNQTKQVTRYNIPKDNLDARRAKAIAQTYPEQYRYIERVVNQVNLTRRIGSVLIDHREDAMGGLDLIPLFRYSPYWNQGQSFGVVDDLISLQDEENKRRSQVLHILNTSANSGWKIAKAVSKAKIAVLEMFGSRAGIVIDESDYGGRVERIDPANLSVGHFTLAQQADADMKTVSGINTAVLGMEANDKESGILNAQRQRQGMTVLEIAFDRFDKTLQQVAQAMLAIIRSTEVYTSDEVRKIVDDNNIIDPIMMRQAMHQVSQQTPPPPPPPPQLMVGLPPEQQQMAQAAFQQAMQGWQQQAQPQAREIAIGMVLEQMKDASVGKYSVRVATSASAPTQQLANFAELSAINQQAPGAIPPDVLVKASSLPAEQKDDIVSRLQNIQGTQ